MIFGLIHLTLRGVVPNAVPVLSNYCISIEYVSPQYVMFSAQTVEERRYLGPVFHGPYVPLRSESSESVSVREFHDTTDVSFIYL